MALNKALLDYQLAPEQVPTNNDAASRDALIWHHGKSQAAIDLQVALQQFGLAQIRGFFSRMDIVRSDSDLNGLPFSPTNRTYFLCEKIVIKIMAFA